MPDPFLLLARMSPQNSHTIVMKFASVIPSIFKQFFVTVEKWHSFVHHCRHIDTMLPVWDIECTPTTLSKVNALFIRDSYKELYALIVDSFMDKDVIVTGTPGIGKTLFLVYFLMRYMRENAEFTVLFCKHSSETYVYFDNCNDGPVELQHMTQDLEYMLENGDLLLLVDAASSSEVYRTGNCRVIVATSPNISNYEDILKDCNPVLLHMPVWSSEELLQACVKISSYGALTEAVVNERFEIWGGIARLVFEPDDEIYTEKCALLDKHISSVTPKTIFKDFSRVDTGKESHQIFHQHLVGDSFTNYVLRFASDYVKSKVCKQVLNTECEMEWLMRSARKVPELGALRGLLFEPFVFDKLCSGRNMFRIRKLFKQEESSDQVESVSYDMLTKIVFHGYDGLQESATKNDQSEYPLLVPAKGNWESVDAIYPPTTLFQMTVSRNHDLKSQGLLDVLQILENLEENKKTEEGCRYSLYFIVPYDMFWYFRKGPVNPTPMLSDSLFDKVDQYVLQFSKFCDH